VGTISLTALIKYEETICFHLYHPSCRSSASPQPILSGPEMLAAYREWMDSCLVTQTKSSCLIVGMSANSTPTDQEEAFKQGMHIFASKPVESLYLDIFVDAVKIILASREKDAFSYSSSTRSSALALGISYVKEKLKEEGLDADSLSMNGKKCVRITSYPLLFSCDVRNS